MTDYNEQEIEKAQDKVVESILNLRVVSNQLSDVLGTDSKNELDAVLATLVDALLYLNGATPEQMNEKQQADRLDYYEKITQLFENEGTHAALQGMEEVMDLIDEDRNE